jgi:hypothetical protein
VFDLKENRRCNIKTGKIRIVLSSRTIFFIF